MGIGEVQFSRAGNVYSGDIEGVILLEGATRCDPHGQVLMRDGERGQMAGLNDGTWHDLSHRWIPQSYKLNNL